MRTRKQILELIGKKIHYLTILEEGTFREYTDKLGRIYKKRYWKCQCDCGNIIEINHGELMKNNRRKSCGCMVKRLTKESISKYVQERYKDLPYTSDEYRFYTSYKSSPTVKHKIHPRPFELDPIEFAVMVNDNCYYCGIEPYTIRAYNKKPNGKKMHGIDRLDSSLGYISSNCVTCCPKCNRAKMEHSEEDFMKWIQLVAQNQLNIGNITIDISRSHSIKNS